jgi:hypothetical protein
MSSRSRKSSGRRESQRSSAKRVSSSPSEITMDKQKQSLTGLVVAFIFTCVLQGLIIYYLYNLEGVDCNCIHDWRHNFIKYCGMFFIFWAGLLIIFALLHISKNVVGGFGILIVVLQVVNLYAFFTYIGDLNETKCKCAVEKQPALNKFMNILRWVELVIFIVAILAVIISLILLGTLISKIKNIK